MKRVFSIKTLAVFSIALIICAALCISASAYSKVTVTDDLITLENDNIVYSFTLEGVVTDYTFKEDGVSYLGSKSYVALLNTPLNRVVPTGVGIVSQSENTLVLNVQFGEADIDFEFVVYDDFITIELLEAVPEGYDSVNLIDIKYNVTYSTTDFVSFPYSLNINTKMEGYPNETGRKFGKATTYSYLGDGGIGAKIALVGSHEDDYYDILQFITEYIADPNLTPVSTMGGPYAQTEEVMDKAVRDYAIISANLSDDEIRFYLDYNVTQFDFHQGTPFIQGSMDFAPTHGDTAAGFKTAITDRIKRIAKEEYGVDALTGLHTYAYYISTSNTELLSQPEVVQQLEFFPTEAYTLSSNVSATIDRLPIYEDNSNFNLTTGFFVYNMRYLRIEDEIAYVKSVTGDTFVVDRGQCGTTAAAHKKGTTMYHLTGLFGGFAPREDSQLFRDIAYYTAKAYVEGGFEMIYLDALDGMGRHTDHSWYYTALFVKEILRNIHEFRKLDEYRDVPDPILEYSTMHNSLWGARTRAGAMDTFARGLKRAAASHSHSNSLDHYHYTYNVGWWALYDSDVGTPFSRQTHFTDVVDLMGKNIVAHNMGFSYNGLSQANVDAYPLHKRNADLLVKYLKLRDEGYFTQDVLDKISYSYDEWALIENSDGEYGFEDRDWSELKFSRLDDVKSANNPFSPQVPKLLRIQALASPSTDKAEVVIADYDETLPIAQAINKGQTFNIGSVNINTYKGAFIRIYGNGQGGQINLTLTSTEDTICSRTIDVNFTGWRDVFISEWDNGLFDLNFSVVISYPTLRTSDYQMVSAEVDYYGNMTDVKIDTVRLVKATTSVIENPSISYNNSTVTFDATIKDGDFIEFDGTTAIHNDYKGTQTEIDFTVDGTLEAPNGSFNVTIGGKGANEIDRAGVSISFAGEQVFNDLSNEAPESLLVVSKPDKSSYIVGETLDPTGIEIYEVMNTGRKFPVESGFTVEEVTFTEAGFHDVEVSYNGLTTTFKVSVAEISAVSVVIETLPDRISYYVGQTLDTTGLSLKVTYNNGKTEIVTEGFSVSREAFKEVGDPAIKVVYEDIAVEFDVHVVAPTLQSLSVTTLPTKTVYTAGELFSTAGMVVTGSYNSGLTSPITDYTFTPNGPLTVGTSVIIIEKNGIKTTVPVTVNEKSDTAAAFKMTAGDVTVIPAAEFTIDFIPNNFNVAGLEAVEFTVSYDTRLTVSGVDFTSPDGWEMWEMESGEGEFVIVLVDEGIEPNPAGEGELCVSVTFLSPEDSENGDVYTVKAENVTGTDSSFGYVDGEGVEVTAKIGLEISLKSSSDYVIDRESGYLYITSDKTTQEEFFKNFNGTLKLSTSTTYVGTGAVVSLVDETGTLDSLTVILRGDVNGNGQFDTTDYSFIKRVFLGTLSLAGARGVAADVNLNGFVDTSDYLLVKKHYTGEINIFAK